MGAGIDIIFSEAGPILASIAAGYPVPLGPTGILFTGLEGGITFGGDPIPEVATPEELLGNPQLFSPFDISPEAIRTRIELAVQQHRVTWNSGFVETIRGNFTTVATPGI